MQDVCRAYAGMRCRDRVLGVLQLEWVIHYYVRCSSYCYRYSQHPKILYAPPNTQVMFVPC